jgi:hypothetical protein
MIGSTEVNATDWVANKGQAQTEAALKAAGYPGPADKTKVNYPMTLLILVILVLYVTMVYGPIAAFLGGTVPDQDPLHLHVPALSHWQRLVWRIVAVDCNSDHGRNRGYLCRSLVPDRCCHHDRDYRVHLPA